MVIWVCEAKHAQDEGCQQIYKKQEELQSQELSLSRPNFGSF
jgi:hypothetical protein